MLMRPAPALRSPAPLVQLLAYYLEGYITEPTWRRMQRILSAQDAHPEACQELARFVHDVLEELGPGSIAEAVLAEATERLCTTLPPLSSSTTLLPPPAPHKRAA
jgi:hypothetical protein